MGRRFVAGVLIASVTAASLVALGRLEAARAAEAQREGLERAFELVSNRIAQPNTYRLSDELACFLYGIGVNAVAVELCFDRSGRLLESSDRRQAQSRVFSLRFAPEEADIVVPTTRLERALRNVVARALGLIVGRARVLIRRCSIPVERLLALPRSVRNRAEVTKAESICAQAASELIHTKNEAERAGIRAILAGVTELVRLLDAQARATYALAVEGGREPSMRRYRAATPARLTRMNRLIARLERERMRSVRALTWPRRDSGIHP